MVDKNQLELVEAELLQHNVQDALHWVLEEIGLCRLDDSSQECLGVEGVGFGELELEEVVLVSE